MLTPWWLTKLTNEVRSSRGVQPSSTPAVGPHRADVTYACRKALPFVACYLSGPVARFMHSGCRCGAGLVATGRAQGGWKDSPPR
jgi:hypothetical protein